VPPTPRFLTNTGLTQVASKLNHTYYANSLLMINYYCGVRNFQESFFCSWQTKTHFWSQKFGLNDAATVIVLNQSNHLCFFPMVHSQGKVEVQNCDKRLSFDGVTARNLIFFRHLDQFPPQGGNRIYCHYSCIVMRVSPTYNSS